jgi:hypothetical protein
MPFKIVYEAKWGLNLQVPEGKKGAHSKSDHFNHALESLFIDVPFKFPRNAEEKTNTESEKKIKDV